MSENECRVRCETDHANGVGRARGREARAAAGPPACAARARPCVADAVPLL